MPKALFPKQKAGERWNSVPSFTGFTSVCLRPVRPPVKKFRTSHGHHSHTAAGSVPLYSNLLGIETAVIAIAAMAVIAVTRTIINFIFFPPVSWWFPVMMVTADCGRYRLFHVPHQ